MISTWRAGELSSAVMACTGIFGRFSTAAGEPAWSDLQAVKAVRAIAAHEILIIRE
jgi:hypothetical protein